MPIFDSNQTTKSIQGLDVALYLRKSRAEDGLSTEEVLEGHQRALNDYAKVHQLRITQIYYEVVSGESLYARPQMLRLLEDIEHEKFEGILCMDLDRLSRGRMRDQGIILDTIRDAGSLIITLDKVYNLSDELDDEIAEMKTFISRREYKIIRKRLRRGLQQAIKNGNYVANAPYGYHKTTINRQHTLEIYEPEAIFVRMIFQLYCQGFGSTTIARQISAQGARPHRSPEFHRNGVIKILNNPTYTGKIVWDQKEHIRKGVNGNMRHTVVHRSREQWTIVNGLHPAIIDDETFKTAQQIMTGRYRLPRYDGTIRSPLAGLVTCSTCGLLMQRLSPKGVPYLVCTRVGCTASVQFEFVEQQILSHLKNTLTTLTTTGICPQLPKKNTDTLCFSLASYQRELTVAKRQKLRLHELLELGEYDSATFHQRLELVVAKITATTRHITETQSQLDTATADVAVPLAQHIESVLCTYHSANIAEKNALLKGIIQNIWYIKQKKSKPHDFSIELVLFPL